ncbi:type VI secretion system lipoprotein TssJ [Pseudomonas matsuisoli]|uniref:Type VI secretion lipoprotein n=1 Tax=Pseudomonas matsuisoli TaxID=1515666 RepID=A0A917UW79_9PSED|nr:type VI secretion system lipoprotein TssJ [Pseudomonas matsuisoli]GGJ89229.1 type VI secretion lipoprotein [Pseudomonas matsuisoli]
MFRSLLFALLVASTISGCSSRSPSSNLTKLDLTLEGSNRLNPDLHGRPSPVVLQLVELKNAAAFEGADFFSLYQRPKETLSPDLIAREELELRPGEQRQLKLSVQEGSRYVGVLAAYRDLPDATWRYVIPLAPNTRNTVTLALQEQGIEALDNVAEHRK